MSDNLLLFHCYGKPYVDYAKLCSFSLRSANVNDPLLFYCDPKYVEELKDFESRWNLDFLVKPLNVPHYKKFYGAGYRFFYDTEYWSGRNVFIGDVDFFYCPKKNFLDNCFSHANSINLPISCIVREIDYFNNSSIKNLASTLYYLGFSHAIKCIKIGNIPIYRAASGGCFIHSDLTSRNDFIKISKKYLSYIHNQKFFKNHPRGINNECMVYDFFRELGILIPINHHYSNHSERLLEDHDGKNIYYRANIGMNLASCRPKKWNSGQGILNPNKFLNKKNGKKVLMNFFNGMNSKKGQLLLEEVSLEFSDMIKSTLKTIKENI